MFYIEDYKELIIGQEYLFINVSGDYVGKPLREVEYMPCYADWRERLELKHLHICSGIIFAKCKTKDGWKLEMISQALSGIGISKRL